MMICDFPYIKYLKNKNDKYIVISLTYKGGISDIDEVNSVLAEEYGDHFLDVRKFMLNYGLDLYKLHPTAQDTQDISDGEIPTSLRSDYVHGNNYFYDIVAQLVYDRGVELGYWK